LVLVPACRAGQPTHVRFWRLLYTWKPAQLTENKSSFFGNETAPYLPEPLGDAAVIVFLLLIAILILVGVSFLSSMDFSDGQRR
jgi:hypothetical protein